MPERLPKTSDASTISLLEKIVELDKKKGGKDFTGRDIVQFTGLDDYALNSSNLKELVALGYLEIIAPHRHRSRLIYMDSAYRLHGQVRSDLGSVLDWRNNVLDAEGRNFFNLYKRAWKMWKLFGTSKLTKDDLPYVINLSKRSLMEESLGDMFTIGLVERVGLSHVDAYGYRVLPERLKEAEEKFFDFKNWNGNITKAEENLIRSYEMEDPFIRHLKYSKIIRSIDEVDNFALYSSGILGIHFIFGDRSPYGKIRDSAYELLLRRGAVSLPTKKIIDTEILPERVLAPSVLDIVYGDRLQKYLKEFGNEHGAETAV